MKKTPMMREIEERIGQRLDTYLKRNYSKNGDSTIDIAKQIDVGSSTIFKWLKKFKIPIRTKSEAREIIEAKKREAEKPSKRELSSLYHSRRMTTHEIGEEFNVTPTTVSRWLRDYKISVRDPTSARLKTNASKISKKDLHRLYFIEGLTTERIGEKYNVSGSSVGKWMKEYDFELRTPAESKLLSRGVKRPAKEELEKFIEDGGSIKGLTREYNLAKQTARRWLREYEIVIKRKIRTSDQFLNFLNQNPPAQNLSATSLLLNGESVDIEQIMFGLYQDRFGSQEKLHELLHENRAEIQGLLVEGLTNLGAYIGNFSLQDRSIIPVLLGQAMNQIEESRIGSSVEEKLIRIFRDLYSPKFNVNSRDTLESIFERREGSEGVMKRVYKKLYNHYQSVLELEQELD